MSYISFLFFTLLYHTECTKQCERLCVAPEKHNNNLLAHLSCTVNVALGTCTRPWVWVWVRVRVPTHGYGYGYGYEPTGMGTGTGTRPWVRVRVRVRHVSKSWVWVRVRVRDHGYGYGYGYGYAISHPGTGTGMGTGTGTTSLVISRLYCDIHTAATYDGLFKPMLKLIVQLGHNISLFLATGKSRWVHPKHACSQRWCSCFV